MGNDVGAGALLGQEEEAVQKLWNNKPREPALPNTSTKRTCYSTQANLITRALRDFLSRLRMLRDVFCVESAWNSQLLDTMLIRNLDRFDHHQIKKEVLYFVHLYCNGINNLIKSKSYISLYNGYSPPVVWYLTLAGRWGLTGSIFYHFQPHALQE